MSQALALTVNVQARQGPYLYSEIYLYFEA